jgi:4,5-DOPA dioxygenase extradiol
MDRRDFLATSLVAGTTLTGISEFYKAGEALPLSGKMPVLFTGHGSPMNIIKDNAFTRSLGQLGAATEKPVAILVISAHWLTPGKTMVSVNPKPKTIYDFGGFPEALYKEKYEPEGHPVLAKELVQQVTSVKIHEDHEMGLDHGAWSILKHMYPKADIPVFQMSIDYGKSPRYHYELAQQLKALRNKGVLILGSGNIVHNLGIFDWKDDAPVLDWAATFDDFVKKAIDSHNHDALINYQKQGNEAALAVPTNDHYLPMLYILGLMDKDEQVRYTYEGFQNASISMRCFEGKAK